MKKRLLVLFVICALVCAFALAACDEIMRAPKLGTPVVRSNGAYAAIWDTIEGAGSYDVKVTDAGTGSELVRENTEETSYMLADFALEDGERTLRVTVTALPASDERSASAPGECTITLPKVSDPQMLLYAEQTVRQVLKEAENISSPSYSYYAKGDLSLKLSFDKKVKSVQALGENRYGFGYTLSSDGLSVTLPQSYLKQFALGAAIQLKAQFEDGSTATHTVFVTERVIRLTEPSELSSAGYIVYSEREGKGLSFTFAEAERVRAVAWDGKKLAFKESKTASGQCRVEASSLSGKEQGLHYLTLYADSGAVNVPVIYIPEYSCAPSNVRVDADAYPKVFVRWDADLMPQEYEVSINGQVFSSLDLPERFGIDSFDATDILDVTSGESVEITVTARLPEEFGGAEYTGETTSADLSAYVPYMTQKFTYLGEEYNFYITSEEEWEVFCCYTALCYDDLQTVGSTTISGLTFEKKRVEVVLAYVDKSASGVLSLYENGLKSFREVVALNGSKSSCKKLADNIFVLEIVHTTALEPSKNASALDAKYSSLNVTNYVSGNRSYSSSGRSGDVFPVDEIEKSVEVSTSMELYFALESGLRPLPEQSSAAERIYEKARAVLARITDEGMSDYEKVHAIYDFLTTEVVYDKAVAEYSLDRDHDQGLYNDVYRFNCFFPEGVFDDGVAVCNGLAQSFVILCAIEGIDSLKIQGGTSGGRHAWNKVEIDGLWYVVDTTWGAEDATSNGVNYRLGDYYWLLVGQNIADEDHHEDEDVLGSDIYCGGVSYDPFANMHFVDEEGVLQDAIADSTQEFNAVLAHYAATYTQSGTYVIAVKITHTYYSQALWREVEGIEGFEISYIRTGDTPARKAQIIFRKS